MPEKYNPSEIEPKWQKYWEKHKLFKAKDFDEKPKYYCLIEFPYPSGEGLHLGHPRSYTAMDIVARKRRMQGFNVLYPIGWDAFGLPAENYAIKTGMHPRIKTEENINNYRRQLKSLGFSFDWSREVSTIDPKYYKWTQWIFLQLFKHGLAYKAEMPINFCTSCKVGLANEEVVNGKCERCGGEVVKKIKKQWMLKITAYADRLEKDLDEVNYLEKIKLQQKNWIGRSQGASIEFQIKTFKLKIEVYTTRPDTLFGATYMVIAPEHQLITNLKLRITNWDEVEDYINNAKNKSDLERTELSKDKTGVELKGLKAISPANHKEIPIWISDYVLTGYGTGAIMAVPAHDQRDYEFAKKFGLEIIEVIKGGDISQEAFTDIEKGEMVNSEFLNGLAPSQAIKKMTNWLEENGLGKKAINYKLRDWVFSRQRYWGEPIPVVYCEKCAQKISPPARGGEADAPAAAEGVGADGITAGEILNPGWIPMDEKDLPLKLPELKEFEAGSPRYSSGEAGEDGQSPLAKLTDWVKVKCPKSGGLAKRETDTMPQWAGSSWYFLRYIDSQNNKKLAAKKKLEYWLPVDWYNGGMEHTTLHLLYSRFWHKFLYDIKVVPTPEPYAKRTSQGMILGEGGEKMSKSRGNVVNPDETVKEYGADTLRVYEMFMGPFDQAIPWDTKGVVGVRRFLEKVWSLLNSDEIKISDEMDEELEILLNQTIKKVSEDIEEMKFNTAVSQMMILLNKIFEKKLATKELWEKFLIILSPFAPHIAEELWSQLGNKKSIGEEDWPKYDDSKIQNKTVEIAVQINGKVRAKIILPANASEEEVIHAVQNNPQAQKYLAGKEIKKTIFVPGKLISFVI